MKTLWNIVNAFKAKSTIKMKLFLCFLVIANIVMGAGVWFLIGRIFLPGIDWLICFMGYPAVFVGFLGGVLYLYNHEFS